MSTTGRPLWRSRLARSLCAAVSPGSGGRPDHLRQRHRAAHHHGRSHLGRHHRSRYCHRVRQLGTPRLLPRWRPRGDRDQHRIRQRWAHPLGHRCQGWRHVRVRRRRQRGRRAPRHGHQPERVRDGHLYRRLRHSRALDPAETARRVPAEHHLRHRRCSHRADLLRTGQRRQHRALAWLGPGHRRPRPGASRGQPFRWSVYRRPRISQRPPAGLHLRHRRAPDYGPRPDQSQHGLPRQHHHPLPHPGLHLRPRRQPHQVQRQLACCER
jgi:hypothetical protein